MQIVLPQRKLLLLCVGISFALASFAAIVSSGAVRVLPPGFAHRDAQIAAATTRVLVDLPGADLPVAERPTVAESLALTDLLGGMMATQPVGDYISRRAGIPADRIAAVYRVTDSVVATVTEPESEKRANDILRAPDSYRLEIQAEHSAPILDVYAQAPTPAEAQRLADAAVGGLHDYLDRRALQRGVDPANRATLHQLGQARGGVVNQHAALKIAALTFLIVFALSLVALVVLAGRLGAPAAADARPEPDEPPMASRGDRPRVAFPARSNLVLLTAGAVPGQSVLPGPFPAWSESARARYPRMRRAITADGDWPRTTRPLPWLLAAFITMLWLVPFDSITFPVSLPIDLKLDRLVLPVLITAWLFWLVPRAVNATRIKLTWIHVTVGAFVALAWLSVVFDAHLLNMTLELDGSIKQLMLLLAYASLFVIVATSVRPDEVRAFLTFMLLLAVLCAIGTIWEYRFHYNVFYDLAGWAFPGALDTSAVASSSVDEIGRRLVIGPASHGLEVVTMLSMALPIALVGIMQSREWRGRILYCLAACLLLAAAVSTYKKSAFVAPISVGVALACFRPREVLRMLPLGLIMLVGIKILSPGAFGSITQQLNSDRLTVGTVSDRSSDYDAIRPDVWSHPAFGRGYGSYDHHTYRILDSEFLTQLVQMGVLGLAAYILMAVAIVVTARATIRARDAKWAPMALACAPAAVAFLVVSALFDAWSFPHVPYIFLTFAGLLAVIVMRPSAPETS